MQDLLANALPLLSPLMSRQNAELVRLANESAAHRKLMMLVRRNSRSVLTNRNQVRYGFDSWRDTQVRLVGEGTAILQAVFMVEWYNTVGEPSFAVVRRRRP